MRLPRAPSPRLRRRLLALLLGAILAVVGLVLGLRLAGPMEAETGLGRASLNVAPDQFADVKPGRTVDYRQSARDRERRWLRGGQ